MILLGNTSSIEDVYELINCSQQDATYVSKYFRQY